MDKLALGVEQLGIEQGRAGSTADCVVRKHRELPIEQAAGAQPADHRRHARGPATPRIRSSRGCGRSSSVMYSMGCAGALGSSSPLSGVNSRHASRICSRVAGVRSLTLTDSRVPVLDRDPVAVRRHAQRKRRNAVARVGAEQFCRFSNHLLFFVPNKRHHIAQDIERERHRGSPPLRPPAW